LFQIAEQGVPSLDQLRQEFAQLAGVIVQVENLPKGKGLIDRTLARLAQTLKWRRTDNFNGADVEAVIARAERALGQSDLASAVTELKTLTAASAAKAGPWLKNAEALVSVNTALNRLQVKAIALLAANE
ncbi:MAG: mitofilin family membrane protein, partial [Rhodospirillales bacterium]|nr:mitofilin family membrane protein [Rhodospirillales bacterium]